MADNHNDGTARRHWIALRVTALLNIPLVVWLVYSVIDLAGADYATFTAWLKHPLNAALMIVLIVSVFYHAALGCHEIIEDYVHEEKTKNLSLGIKAFLFLVAGLAGIYSIVKVAFL